MSTILVTGGAGYLGSHTCVELLERNHDVLVVDNLSNGCLESLHRVEQITGKAVRFVEGDVRDRPFLDTVFRNNSISLVIHFAGLKAVAESCSIPLVYYDNNVAGAITLCQSMADNDVRNLVFSSAATVYGEPASVPVTEDFPLSATNPYGRSKLIIEEILTDLHRADDRWNIALLRYFNPVGAHPSGLIGEDPGGVPGNLMPLVTRVAIGKQKRLQVFGNDYPTPDGTGVRDYIHVQDLARGHVCAIRRLQENCGIRAWNLGVGQGHSVLEMVSALEQVSGRPVPYDIVARRPGDIATCYADPARARLELGWSAEKTLDDMVSDAWRWQLQNPDGYRG